MDLTQYTIFLDSWESEADYDLDTLWAGGVRGLMYRLNDTRGTLHPDTDFVKNTDNARNWNAKHPADQRFAVGLYNVYSPWESPLANFQFIDEHRPKDIRWCSHDMELKNTAKTPEQHADEYQDYINRLPATWTNRTYTGGWFWSVLAHWPKMGYHWARYPFAVYPTPGQSWTWEKLKAVVGGMAYAPTYGTVVPPGLVDMWQMSGDRLNMPGTGVVDINVFQGTHAQLLALATFPEEKPAEPTLEEKVNRMWLAFITK